MDRERTPSPAPANEADHTLTGGDFSDEKGVVIQEVPGGEKLKRTLQARHLQMIAIGGTIGNYCGS